jgi:hypothetical protein
MHSAYETAGVQDICSLTDAMTVYYGLTLETSADGCLNLR